MWLESHPCSGVFNQIMDTSPSPKLKYSPTFLLTFVIAIMPVCPAGLDATAPSDCGPHHQ